MRNTRTGATVVDGGEAVGGEHEDQAALGDEEAARCSREAAGDL